MVFITEKMIADAIIELYRDEVLLDVWNLIRWLLRQTHQKKGNPYQRLCEVALKDYSHRTIKISVNKLYYKFTSRSWIIEKVIKEKLQEEILQQKNINKFQIKDDDEPVMRENILSSEASDEIEIKEEVISNDWYIKD